MKILKRVSSIQKHMDLWRKKRKSIGFIPTMGALHEGHLSLVRKSVEENDITVVSIFVNPTQFNEKTDLDKYPRNLKKDAAMLKSVNADYIFAPSVTQIYPKKTTVAPDLDISLLTQNMEGPNRPGHFEGVVQVVYRLLDIIKPQNLYMGQKDFQQFTIIRYMLEQLNIPTALRVCQIIREENGLAMSSRNMRLSKSLRQRAHILHDNLLMAKKLLKDKTPEFIEKKALKNLDQKDFRPEYFKIVDGFTLKEIKNQKRHKLVVACTAVWAKNVRLIDNMILKGDINRK
ncbi:MAG: pantoate--beta-alanine ligase [Saprospiraceae bacterium]|nr:pantoate--beta-alanine ligase [Saprospiraceae bacterium]